EPLAFARLTVLLPATELLLQRAAHLPRAFLQRLDRLLLGGGGALVIAGAQIDARFAHGLIGIGQRLRHLTGQVAELLHHLTQRATQRPLHALVHRPLRRRVVRRRVALRRLGLDPPWLAGLLVAALCVIQQSAFASHHVLHGTHLPPALLALLAVPRS